MIAERAIESKNDQIVISIRFIILFNETRKSRRNNRHLKSVSHSHKIINVATLDQVSFERSKFSNERMIRVALLLV